MQLGVPIIVPCFNNPTYVAGMLTQLQARNLSNIVLIDSHSTYPQMLELLQRVEKDIRIIRLRKNKGPKYFLDNWLFYVRLPRVFCVTDPDLKFNDAMPPDFVSILLEATERFSIGKAGLALDISNREAMRSDRVTHIGKTYKIWEWEEQFWRQQVAATPDGDPIYKAWIDTTFALYNKKYFREKNFYNALRFAGRFTAQHLPWYIDNGLPKAEEDFYRASVGSRSWYFGAKSSNDEP